MDVKFASGIKNINCGLYPYTDVCMHCILSTLSQAYYSGGIRTPDPCNSRAVSYQLDYRDCWLARGSSNHMFWQRDLECLGGHTN